MTVYVPYGGTAADMLFTIDPVTGDVQPAAGGTAGVWTAPTGGSALTDLLDSSGNPVTHVTAAADGTFAFQVPTGLGTVYVDSGLPSGSRFGCSPTGLASVVATLASGTDNAALATQVATLQSQVATLQTEVAALQAGGGGTTPSAPATPVLTATPGDGQVTLNWSDSTPLANRTGYTLTYPGHSTALAAAATSLTVTGLTNGTAVTFSLTATGPGGTSAAATATATPVATVTSPPPTASAPTGVTATPGDGQLVLAWTAPASSSEPVTHYLVEAGIAGTGTWTAYVNGYISGSPVTVTGLTNGTAYQVRVTAGMADGLGTPSAPVTATPAAAAAPPPTSSAPGGLTAVAGDAQVVLSWSAPGDNTAAVTDYQVQFRTSPSGAWATFAHTASTALTSTVTGLTDAVAYDFQVAAVMTGTVGTYAAPVTATPEAAGGGGPSWMLPDALYADSFNRADSSALGSIDGGTGAPVAWTVNGGTGFAIAGNLAVAGGAAGASDTIDTGHLGGTQQVTLAAFNAGNQLGILFRSDSNGYSGGYNCCTFSANASGYHVYGGGIVLSGAPTPAVGDVLKVVDDGSTITCYVNGVAVGTGTSAAPAGQTFVGLWGSGSLTDWSYSTATA